MEPFIRIGDTHPSIGVSELTPEICQVIAGLVRLTAPPANAPRDVRGQYRSALKHARNAQVRVMPELVQHVGPVDAEVCFPALKLQDLAYHADDPHTIALPTQPALETELTWKHRALVQHAFFDRIYQSADADLAQPKRILALTIGRCGDILGAAHTPNHDRAFLLALYAAVTQLEAEMRTSHPRFAAHIAGPHGVNRHRLRAFTTCVDYLKSHTENLLRVCVEYHH